MSSKTMRMYSDIGLVAPAALIPTSPIDLHKWAVVACDQYTSQLDYWEAVENEVGDHPSTYHLILPEAFLGTPREPSHQAAIAPKMREYLQRELFSAVEGFIYIEREISGSVRSGILAALDLEKYDYSRESTSLIRATEGTILERIPPRVRIREEALLEVPHVMVLIDDPACSVIEPLGEVKPSLTPLYDFDLMMAGGHISGYLVESQEMEKNMTEACHNLLSPQSLRHRYGQKGMRDPLLLAVGDGNHSLATAKTIWEKMKAVAAPDHPARFALVEIVNIHSPAIQFEPIHRVVKNIPVDVWQAANEFFRGELEIRYFDTFESMTAAVISDSLSAPTIGIFNPDIFSTVKIANPLHTLAVGNIQVFLDDLVARHPQIEIDYIHGSEAIQTLGTQRRHTGFFLPAMGKNQLFPSVIRDGPLPRKTFSMGEANEKRFYLECRLIKDNPYAISS